MIEGHLENWEKTHKLALRTHLGEGSYKDAKGKEVKFSFSLNVDNKAIFIEFGNVKVTYLIPDLIDDAIKQFEGWKRVNPEGVS